MGKGGRVGLFIGMRKRLVLWFCSLGFAWGGALVWVFGVRVRVRVEGIYLAGEGFGERFFVGVERVGYVVL